MPAERITPKLHFDKLAHFLDLEAEAEKQESLRERTRLSPAEAESSGNSLIQLVIREEDSGLGGRFLVTFGKRNQTLPLPWTRLGVGSPVLVSEERAGATSNEENAWRGIVSRVRKDSIQVAFNQMLEIESERPTFRIDRATDEISRARQRQALDTAKNATSSRLATLRDVLLGIQKPLFQKVEPIQPFNKKLNTSQIQAIEFALSAEDVAIIHGPPGTGKTTTLVELIRQITKSGGRVLAVAGSNLAVDNLLERLIDAGENAIRLGHPARVTPELREHTLDLLVEHHPDLKIAQKLTRDAHSLRKQASKFFRIKPDPNYRQSLREESKQLLNEANQIEEQVVASILNGARVVCATATGLDPERLRGNRFDWVIMDEASQSTEPAAWIPLQYAERLVLAGDHCQLPPTVLSNEAARGGFNISMMERILNFAPDGLSKLLSVQYRMHQDIMTFSSDIFYDGHLQADEAVRTALLTGLPHVSESPLTVTPIHFIDTAGASYDEEQEPDGESRMNPLEAELVVKMVNGLMENGVSPENIAVISPYSAQVKLLRQKLNHGIEIDSVDGFQGREKEVVIVSLVRSNPEGDVGFLADTRRMNVALTRAKRKLIVIGDSATITVHPFYEKMVKYFESIGAYHSVWEE
ncbi:MAG: AAA family ATPase [Chloroflexi bacterium]|nr:AAA family ATPase [Chloroflexota bacterium]